ncbi:MULTISPECIES: pyruvate dehydrogenase complex dihydrolipoamide acetyltransferase [Brucella]|uniref:Acetyltransferase component of pyruvate dehydrogenase complex n=3 Tax=Brucella pseudogrignonensis TaxID=419475 RepID=A0A1A9FLK5_9HYPH|nr:MULTISPECIES: pyruvate dehydrogenase complex dihydrolipoamide acetyltransferase [Brucella]EMG54436.1 branched-chain alpha-keto acid dehydrogenase subunit E2 [Ochrobactrum sp. CDB2]MBK0021109.1 pyruvate dehydrogenase complex dihydrolipoamide acetyltransferase [Ochrobactrum sp. S45]MBK0042153.1 pyruvate dehydrogenase complex dihydrolipoamide acetyltransferase [Ochrobactrum sp. S46]MQP38849.1 pyruvate dehydrogenase complex dihydrolipoamide acetyltransferase [Ochrobactrum sp. MYb237]ANG95943.1 
MPIKITMPALSPTMEEGNLSKWLVKEGDKVTSGDVIAEIETDKATMEVEAVDEGVVAKLVVPAGTEGVKVNALIAILAEDGEDVAEAAKGGDSAPAPKAEAAKEEPKKEVATAAPAKAEAPAAAPAAAKSAENKGDRVFASPLARRIAKDAGVDVSAVKGTGPHGRVVQRDVEAAIKSGGAKAASAAPQAAASAPKPQSDDAILKLFEEGTYEIVPHDGMRKTIARRLVESKQTVPHFYLTIDCELDALLALRSQINSAAPLTKTEKGEVPAYKLSVNDLVIKAVALALRDIPEANVSWTEGGMIKHKRADVGVAVSIPGGLITPIVRQSESKTLSAISNEMKDLAKRARDRKLKPDEYQGGSTSVSNLGMFGVKDFAAIINPPHATIFAIGAGEQRAVVKNGEIKVATVMSVTLSTDHRAVDGALAAELAQAFKRHIENPMGMLV